jgi:DNA-binding MarR family transcriptional regulator
MQIYNRLKYKITEKHILELKILELEKQIKLQREKANLLSEQIAITLSRTNQTNSKLDSINSLLELLNENILNKTISQYQVISPEPSHVSNSNIKQSQTEHNIISHSQTEQIDDNRKNSTIEYILKKLENNSLSTREIQRYVGRTREHTSRLMKKLYDNKYVDRDMDSKSFRYTITNEGHKLLIKHSASKNNHHSDYLKSKENLTDGLTEIQYSEN